MSRLLADLLGVNEQLLGVDLHRLELASGQPSVDVRLTADIIGKSRFKTRALGLDPQDSTGRELYYALLNLTGLHDQFLLKKMGLQKSDDPSTMLKAVQKLVKDMKIPKKAWVLKSSVAKKLLKQQAPKQVMKYLGYKSLDSMIKRESIHDLFAGIYLLESRSWLEQFIGQYRNLRQMDFEDRTIEVTVLDSKKWEKASRAYFEKQHHIILTVRELGSVFMLPAPLAYRPGLAITVLSQVLYQLNEVRLYSSFYKLHQMRSDLGYTIAESLLRDQGMHLYLAGQNIHWRAVQRYFGRPQTELHSEVFEPHVQPEDLHWYKPEASLYHLEPALYFWHDMDYVGLKRGRQPISFNLMDMALNYLNAVPYERRFSRHLQDAIWNELYERYVAQPALEAAALKQLDNEASTLDLLALLARGNG